MKFNVVVLLLLCTFIGLSIPSTNGFNVETQHYTIYEGQQKSMFGFSVAEHLDHNSRGWVIVGAPEAQSEQLGVYRGGSVYRCDPLNDNDCSTIYFDTEGDLTRDYEPGIPTQIENKTLQWFGASVSTSQIPDGPILACAPRYIWFSTGAVRREPIGTCYMTRNSFREPKEFSPCRTRHWGYHRQGSCQAGLGAALSKDGKRVFVGAPGSYYWQGQAYSIDSKAEFPYIPPQFSYYGGVTGQAISASTETLPAAAFTKEGQAIDDDSYLGYSVAAGNFEGNGKIGAAVGMPRGNNLQGKVVLLRTNMTTYTKNLTGVQMGEYFGYSVISCDIDGDGLDDLVVGAPMYTMQDNPGMTIETGRVHIFYQGSGAEKFTRSETREGVEDRGRFGLSLASLKDINLDGYQDFAVGAPYGGPDGRGAVYIFHGSKDGVSKKYSQAIYSPASKFDLLQPGPLTSAISTFGFSVAGGLDLDGNQYPDIVVGAYDSNAVTFFRSRPVLDMKSSVSFDTTSKSISLESKNCLIDNVTRAVCVPLTTCLNFTGLGVGQSYQFNVQYFLDVKKPKDPRMFFVDYIHDNHINQTIRLTRGQELCRTFRVYVKPDIRDKLTSLEAEMRMSLIESRGKFRNSKELLTPVLRTASSQPDSLTIFKECGEDNVCVPNLQLLVETSVKKYLLGSGEKLYLDILVQNTGEDAFEAMYHLKLPKGINYVNVEHIDNIGIPVDCSTPEYPNNYTVHCNIGNPLPKNNNVHFKISLQPVTKEGMNASYEMEMTVNSTNSEASENQADNNYHLSLPLWIQTELEIEGQSKPKELFYDFENYNSDNITYEWQFGPVITHNYTIRNKGPSEVLEAQAFLIWPGQTLAGEELVYLMEQPKTSDKGVNCFMANANYLSLKLDDRRDSSQGGSYEGFSGISSIDRQIQLAEDSRRKHQNETSGSQEVIKDYDYSESSFSNATHRNFSTSGSSSRNFSFTGGFVSSSEQKTSFESAQNSSGQSGGAVFIPVPEIVTEIYTGQVAQISGGGAAETFGETRYEQNWNRNGALETTIKPSTGFSSSSGGTAQTGGSVGAVETFGETRYEQNWNRGSGGSGSETVINPSRSGEGGTGGSGTFGETRYEQNWNREGDFGTVGIPPRTGEGRVGGSGGSGRFGETRYEQSWNRSGSGGGSEATINPARSGEGGTGGSGTFGETRYEQNWNREGDFGAVGIPPRTGEGQVGGSGGSGRSGETRYEKTWNREGDLEATIRPVEIPSRTGEVSFENSWNRSGVFQHGWDATGGKEGEGGYVSGTQVYRGSSGRNYQEEEEERRRVYEAERNRAREEWERQETERRYNLERQRTGTENKFVTTGGGNAGQGVVHTSRVSSSGFGSHFINIGLPQDMEKFFSALSGDAASITTHSRDGKDFVMFDGRFRVGGNKEYIEFRNGQYFELLDRNGEPITATAGLRLSEQFAKLEGQLLGGAEEGVIYIELNDGRRFKIPGTYSYERKESYVVGGGGPVESRVSYGTRFTQSGNDGDVSDQVNGGNVNAWREESSYQTKWRSGEEGVGRKIITKKYETTGESFYGDNVPTRRPEDGPNRYPRESDALDVGQFKKWERKHRRERDVAASSADNLPQSNSFGGDVYGTFEDGEGPVCNSAKCASIQCTIGPLARNEEVWISMRARVKAKTLNKIAFNDDVTVSTQLVAQVTKQPFINGPPVEQQTKSYEIRTTIQPSAPPKSPDVIPLWVVVLSACAGTIILLLLIFLLYKCGFFKRNRPTDSAERQPLNRNGHYQE